MVENLARGLVNNSEKASTLKMLPTNVTSTPDGTEQGTFLVLELKQDTFQISQVKLDGRNNPEIESENFSIPKTQLFEDIASYLATFKKRRNIQDDLPIGFTFPFTFIENMEDENYEPKHITFVNDTVGTMMNCGFNHSDCEAGLIVGVHTGYDADVISACCPAVPLADCWEERTCLCGRWARRGMSTFPCRPSTPTESTTLQSSSSATTPLSVFPRP
ncbi:hexokinase-2 isoform X2 [Pelobates cultripes]|uniref:Phosphotransferase n=1 Tax=Pelobates cultripes TaxID=61616 RepID=A0AAD1RT64_PELCU|nr:hexokinase-2 isoform X2 [Pelobates cultripes]